MGGTRDTVITVSTTIRLTVVLPTISRSRVPPPTHSHQIHYSDGILVMRLQQQNTTTTMKLKTGILELVTNQSVNKYTLYRFLRHCWLTIILYY